MFPAHSIYNEPCSQKHLLPHVSSKEIYHNSFLLWFESVFLLYQSHNALSAQTRVWRNSSASSQRHSFPALSAHLSALADTEGDVVTFYEHLHDNNHNYLHSFTSHSMHLPQVTSYQRNDLLLTAEQIIITSLMRTGSACFP